MSRPRPPYLHRTITRHNKISWYVWKRPGPKIRIRGEYGSKEFMAAYRAALDCGGEPQRRPAVASDSLKAIIMGYQASPVWAALSPATQRKRRNILAKIEKAAGNIRASDLDSLTIKQNRDRLPYGAAQHFVQTVRALYRWAKEAELVENDPTEGVTVLRPKIEGHKTWTDEAIAAYEARWPIGSRERLWLAILLYTGLRRGDALALGPRHVKDGIIEIRTSKTRVRIILPLAPELEEIIAASPIGQETFIANPGGRPMEASWFARNFAEACQEAGVYGTPHGLRKAAARRLAEAGATVAELNAVFGWSGVKMASHYTIEAERAKLARSAMRKLRK